MSSRTDHGKPFAEPPKRWSSCARPWKAALSWPTCIICISIDLQHLTTSYRFQTAIGCNRALGLLRFLVLRQIGDLKGEAKARQPCIGTRCHDRCMPLISSNGFCGMFVGCTQWRLPISLLSCSARPGPEILNHITYRTYTDIAYKSAAQLENIPMSYQSVTHFRLCGMQGKEDYGCQTVCKGCALMTTWKPPPRRRRRHRCCCCCCCCTI